MIKKGIYILFLLAVIALWHCSRMDNPVADLNRYASLADTVNYVGMATCRSCHPNVYNSFIRTGMGQSFDRATKQKTSAFYGAHARVYDPQSDFYYHPFFRDSSLFIMEFRLDGKDTIHKRIEKVSYIVGSGHHTNSHIIDINGYLFQAPITYYTQDGRWDLAPGFENENLRFSRILMTECLTCHNHYPEAVPGSANKYANLPTGIECERCHGPGEVHVKEKLAGIVVDTSQQIDYSIVNPHDLPRDRQMDLCQRCHLQGLAVLEPGRTFYDFQPGMALSEVFNVFLPRYTNSHENFIMASQADRLRLSKCYSLSDDMTCLTCHHPHHSVRQQEKSEFNNICTNCHQKKKVADCSAPSADRTLQNDNCTGCHMPPSGSMDITHVNITDHYISKKTATDGAPIAPEQKAAIARFLGLELLTKEKGTPLDMARGYLAMHDKYVESAVVLDSAAHHLGRADDSHPLYFPTQVHFLFAGRRYQELIGLSANHPAATIADAWTAYRIGEAFAKSNEYAKALLYYKKAVALMPLQLEFQEKLGTTYLGLQYLPQARKVYEWILSENPKREVALCNLGYIEALQGHFAKAENLYDKALALDPDYEQALVNKAALKLFLKDESAARNLSRRILRLNPGNVQARRLLE